jgi:parvulin-like peptidyl-prolyl isomerase
MENMAMDGKLSQSAKSRAAAIAQRAGWFASGMLMVGVCLLYRWYSPSDSAVAKPPASAVKKASAVERGKSPADLKTGTPTAAKKNPVAAIVNNEPITREDLARDCLLHYGVDVLESMVNRALIQASCQQRNIVISDQQVADEIDRMARKFSLPKEQWLQMLEKERGIKPERYAQDIIWPTLALRELAKSQLQVSKKELDEAYESEFGPAVKVRLIAMDDPEKARSVHAQACAKPDDFPALAKNHSQDTNSASAYGLIQPIRRRMGDPNLEQAAFSMKKGEISKIIQVGELYVFIKCEEHLPAAKGIDRAKVEPLLLDALKDRKLRAAASDVFKDLQATAVVENVYNDPVKSKQMPGVAATINGQKITIRELSEECVERHGNDVLEGAINRRLLDQALRKKNLKISDDDIGAEIGRAAVSMGKVKGKGEPDVAAWLEHITKTQNISREVYVRDEVWPSVALKKLVGENVQVTKEDMQRGYEANYGPKVRCRAIVLNNHRRAQEVWEKARKDQSVKNFGDLAEQYSIEAGSRTLHGEVPPIQRHGGQPLLESEAFALTPESPLSGIIQVGSTFVILFYEGRTTPIKTNLDEVKDLLYRDIHEKKQRVAMAKVFERLKEDSHVDNFLAGNIKVPKKEQQASMDIETGLPTPRVMKR